MARFLSMLLLALLATMTSVNAGIFSPFKAPKTTVKPDDKDYPDAAATVANLISAINIRMTTGTVKLPVPVFLSSIITSCALEGIDKGVKIYSGIQDNSDPPMMSLRFALANVAPIILNCTFVLGGASREVTFIVERMYMVVTLSAHLIAKDKPVVVLSNPRVSDVQTILTGFDDAVTAFAQVISDVLSMELKTLMVFVIESFMLPIITLTFNQEIISYG